MERIKIGVTGNYARVIDRPDRITSGTVGLPVEFTFDEVWDGLSKTAVFKGGDVQRIVEDLQSEAEVPWEVLAEPGVWLSIGVYGTNRDGSVAIPTIWVNVTPIEVGADPAGDPSTDPKLPVYQKLLDDVGDLDKLRTEDKEDLVKAINEVNSIALAGGVHTDPTLSREGRAADAKATGDELQQVKTSVDDAKQTAENAQKAADTAQEAADTAQQTAEKKLEGTDTTLSVSGKAADAKATGDRLGVLETEVRPVERGGTGANTAEEALAALGAMKSTLVNEEFKIFVFEGPNLDETLQSIFTNMIGGTNKVIKAVRENAFIDHEDLASERFSLEGGSEWMILLTKASSKYGSVFAWQYGKKRPVIKIKAVYNDSWSEWETITTDITEGSWVTLWENETYTSAFDPRIVEIAEGKKYKTLYIIFRHSTTYGHTSYAQLISGTGVKHYPAATLTGTSGASTKLDETYRYFIRTDMTHVSFQPGYKGSSVDNTACVPFAIYGVKY